MRAFGYERALDTWDAVGSSGRRVRDLPITPAKLLG
jgi:hypothetical protein